MAPRVLVRSSGNVANGRRLRHRRPLGSRPNHDPLTDPSRPSRGHDHRSRTPAWTWSITHRAGGALLIAFMFTLLVRKNVRNPVFALLCIGIASHVVIDYLRWPPTGRTNRMLASSRSHRRLPGFLSLHRSLACHGDDDRRWHCPRYRSVRHCRPIEGYGRGHDGRVTGNQGRSCG